MLRSSLLVLTLALAMTGCSSSSAPASPRTDAGGDAASIAEGGAPVLCDYQCGTVDAPSDASSTQLCKSGQICGMIGTIPGFQCCTPSDPPGDNCYAGPVQDAAVCPAQ